MEPSCGQCCWGIRMSCIRDHLQATPQSLDHRPQSRRCGENRRCSWAGELVLSLQKHHRTVRARLQIVQSWFPTHDAAGAGRCVASRLFCKPLRKACVTASRVCAVVGAAVAGHVCLHCHCTAITAQSGLDCRSSIFASIFDAPKLGSLLRVCCTKIGTAQQASL